MNKTNSNAIIFIAALLILAFLAGTQTNYLQNKPTPTPIQQATPTPTPSEQQFVGEGITRMLTIDLPAVNKRNEGVLAKLNIEARSGTGRIYIDYSQGAPLLGSETQNSILTAVSVAKDISGKSLKNTNLYYSLSTDAQEVGGGSAGAATAIATSALLSGKEIRQGFIITGTISEDGIIGKVGRILEKAQAAKKAGYTTFLVPDGEAYTTLTKEECNNTNVGSVEITSCNDNSQAKSVQELVGIDVIEVSNVRQAFGIMAQ